MKFLVTGNLGYIGTSIIQQLRSSNPKAEIIGLDIGLFSHCLSDPTTSPDIYLNKQIFKDVKNNIRRSGRSGLSNSSGCN